MMTESENRTPWSTSDSPELFAIPRFDVVPPLQLDEMSDDGNPSPAEARAQGALAERQDQRDNNDKTNGEISSVNSRVSEYLQLSDTEDYPRAMPERRIITNNIFNDELYNPSFQPETSASPASLEPTGNLWHHNDLVSELERENGLSSSLKPWNKKIGAYELGKYRL